MGFQTQVFAQPAPAVEGDFCDSNPRYAVVAGPGGMVAGPGGAVVGRFCWATSPPDGDGSPSSVKNSGFGTVTGFLHRQQQGLITAFLAESSMVVREGFPLALLSNADVWVKNAGASQALPGQKAYANFTDGSVTFAATATPTAGATSSASAITAGTSSVTGSITGGILTVTAVGSGTVYPGTTLSGTGVATGTQVVRQLTSTAALGALGSTGTYAVSIAEQTATSTTISGTYGLLTVGGTVAGVFAVGQLLAATGSVVAGTYIRALGTGTGGAGTYIVDNNTAVTSQAINVAAINVETKWIAMSSGLTGELVKISAQPLG